MNHPLTHGHLAATLLIAAIAGQAGAAPVSIGTPFMNLENRAINSLGFGVGQFLRIGANTVLPNGAGGTTGVGTTTNLLTGALVTRTINADPSPLNANMFDRYLADDRSLYGPWMMTFTNATGGTTNTASATVSLPLTAQQAPFVNSITLSGSGEAPKFTWTPPPGATVNGYRLNIFDKALIGPGNNGNIVSLNVPPAVNSYTVDPGDFRVPGYAFALNRNYSLEISLIQTKDGSSTNLGNGNLQAIARVYADFTPKAGGGPVVNLPVVLDNGSYKFNMTVLPGQTYYIDPEVAIGYDYAIGSGNPNFKSVSLPTDIGDGLYDIFGYDPLDHLVLLAHDLAGGSMFDFGTNGVSRFRVMGIETSAGLNPANTTAFVTGLVFTGAGAFTGTQTPINATVPEPPMLALCVMVLAASGLRRRGREKRQG